MTYLGPQPSLLFGESLSEAGLNWGPASSPNRSLYIPPSQSSKSIPGELVEGLFFGSFSEACRRNTLAHIDHVYYSGRDSMPCHKTRALFRSGFDGRSAFLAQET